MGTKIKPSFKSEFPRLSEGWHLLRVVEPRVDTIPKDEQKEKDGITNDKNFVVRSAAEGGDEDGIEINDFFANHSKKEFGLSRLAGLMIVTGALELDAKAEIDVDMMRTEKFESKFKMSLPKRLYGGRVKYVTSTQKKEGTEEANVFANIVEYVTKKEYDEIITKLAEKKKGTTESVPKPESSKNGKETKASEKDPWA